MPPRPPAIGIDLGTTHAAVALATPDGRAEILADPRGRRVHASAVSFHPSGGVLVADEARARRLTDPGNTILGAKRLVGKTYGSEDVAAIARLLPLELSRGENDEVAVHTRAGLLSVPEVLAYVIDYLRGLAERRLQGPVDRAVIAVPANFHDGQRAATATAGAIAGVEVPFLVTEPTAAAVAYGARRPIEGIVAVYDFGGGTFDVSLLALSGGVYEVLATAGDSTLGGDAIDDRLVDDMAEHFAAREGIDLRADPVALSRLRAGAEELKVQLSFHHRASCRLEAISGAEAGAPRDFVYQLTRDDLVALCFDLIERTFPVCDEALRRAQLSIEDVGDVVLVGGSTRMPHVRQRVAQHFGRAARTDVDPEGAVALGAALQAAALGGRRATLADALALTEEGEGEPTRTGGVEGGFEGSQTIDSAAPPYAQTADWPAEDRGEHSDWAAQSYAQTADWPAEDRGAHPAWAAQSYAQTADWPAEDRGEHPDWAAQSHAQTADWPAEDRGAHPDWAAQSHAQTAEWAQEDASARGSLPSGDRQDAQSPAGSEESARAGGADSPAPARPPLGERLAPPAQVSDLTSHSLNLVTVAGFCEPIIARDTRVPASQTRAFTPARENQASVDIRICQGESKRADENVDLGHLELSGLSPRPREATTIYVTFAIDERGLLAVTARDDAGRERVVELNLVGTPRASEIERARARLTALRFPQPGH